MTYERVGSVDDVTIDLLADWLSEAEWKHWNEAPRDYFTWHVTPEDVVEILPIFHEPMQQFFIRLAPGGQVHKHVDRRKGHTFHIPVYTNDRCECYHHTEYGTITNHLEVGGIYSVDRTVMHSSRNMGETDRVHLLVEVPYAI